jgi:hypothetical protein
VQAKLKGVDSEQERYAQIATFTTIVINVAKLLENKSTTWNLLQLCKEWTRYAPSKHAIKDAQATIAAVQAKLAWLVELRHSNEAHQTKTNPLTLLTVPPLKIDFMPDLVRAVDVFADGPIPYTLHLHESGQNLDLRAEFGLSPKGQ